ncbi:MAG: hypothetical protein J7500_07280 [Sphingomonas sp.]|uniref:hypothetical protein n=1 Tax=Sphingomonas sp. TaxID=28214 RepID=UPI001B21B9C3|nr:hypothetical protein [Sphingomonas sp.]MBO9622498.1 hypothetical protein [Sphingomonas sp.]
MTDRYAGKPFLRLVDSYVLDAIGHLDSSAAATLTSMEPQLRATLGAEGSWREMVESRMQFPEGMQGAIREVWEKGRVRFVAAQGHEPDPHEFTRTFVDTKFPH